MSEAETQVGRTCLCIIHKTAILLLCVLNKSRLQLRAGRTMPIRSPEAFVEAALNHDKLTRLAFLYISGCHRDPEGPFPDIHV